MAIKNFLLCSTFLLTACSGGGGSSSSTVDTGETNSAPSVNAGTDITADERSTVQLDGTASDADGDTLTYTWSQQSGTTGTFDSTTVEDPTFTLPSVAEDEDIVLQLTVSDGTTSSSDTMTIAVTEVDDDASTSAGEWIINTVERSNYILEASGSSAGALYDVQSVAEVTVDGEDYIEVHTDGIPRFDVEITQDILDDLNARPRQSGDFETGQTTAILGQTIEFGQSVGYNSADQNCPTTGGDGYWPPGPACPTIQDRTEYLPVTPTPSDQACDTGIGTIGLYINGSAIFGWGDTFSYQNQGVFNNLAAELEFYDLDICSGHSANGQYHTHNYSQCIADLVGDDGTDHSPIIGYAADGYPIYGPWEADGQLAVSGWVARDYGASEAEGGCNTPGERTCVLVDEFDLSQGVTQAPSNGPDIGEEVTSLSGNVFAAGDGFYYEDFYYAGRDATGVQLDQHNGHDNDDGRGYHYHVTLAEENGERVLAFPFTLGPTLYGEVPDNGISSCGGNGGGGPPGGRP